MCDCVTQTIGDDLVDSIISDNIPILADDAKFNEAVTSSLRRIEVRILARLALVGPHIAGDNI